MNFKRLENHAMSLLEKLKIKKAPIDPYEIAERLSIKVCDSDFADNVSGILYVDESSAVIGYNSNHTESRQRFTVAHEIAHYILHRNNNDFFMDKQFSMIFQRDISSQVDNKKEKEANAFAAALLMPQHLLQKEIRKNDYDDAHEVAIDKLAKRFKVSTIAMTYRLTNLGYF